MAESKDQDTSVEERLLRLENGKLQNAKRRLSGRIFEAVIAGIIFVAGALVIYPPIKDVIDAEGELALLKAEKAEVGAEITHLRATLQNEKNIQEKALLEKENERTNKELVQLKADLTAVRSEKDKAIEYNESTQVRLGSIQEDYRKLLSQTAENESTKNEYEQKIATITAELTSLVEAHVRLKKERESTTRIIDAVTGRLVIIKSRVQATVRD